MASHVPVETAALTALLRTRRRPPNVYADLLEDAGSARAILEEEQGLLAPQLIDEAEAELAQWQGLGIRAVTLLEPDYPQNLRAVFDRPPLLFIRGGLAPSDTRSVAVIGSRQASPAGLRRARAISELLVESGYVIVSGLAAGIDAAAHTTALERRGRTVAVIGTGLMHAYPAQNAPLQQRISADGAVLSQFWPETGPRRQNFLLRNRVMSGTALATLIVEATHASGARTQARSALAHGRPVLLASALLEQQWARELSDRPAVHVIRSLSELTDVLARLSATDALVA